MANSSGYTAADVRQSLLTFIREFGLDQSLYESLDIDAIAVQLIKSVKPVDKLQLLWASLRAIGQPVGTPLQLCLSQCESYINKIYCEPHKFKARENQKLYALISLVNQNIAKDIAKDMKLRRESNEDACYSYYRSIALRLEQSPENVPKSVLKYGSTHKLMGEGNLELWNTTDVKLNNIIFDRNNTEGKDEEEEVNYAKYNSLVNNTIFSPKPIRPFREEMAKDDLGKIWVDRGEDDVHIYININNKYYFMVINRCPPELQYHLLKDMQTGNFLKDLALIWEANVIYQNLLTKSDFMEARNSGVKPNET